MGGHVSVGYMLIGREGIFGPKTGLLFAINHFVIL